MTADTERFVDSYLGWLRQHVTAEALESGVTELTTPFLDRHNDHLQIYAERLSPDAILLTDDGYILAELKSSGVESRGRRREELFQEILSGYGVQQHGRELQVHASPGTLGQRAHSLLQAMISLDDMFVLAQPKVSSVFFDDVASYLDEHDIRYAPRVKFAGKSGLDHLIDFVIPKSKHAPERILEVVNKPRRDRVVSLLFAVSDMRAARGKDGEYFALVNDAHSEVGPEILAAFSAYNVSAVGWARREEITERLVA